MVLIALLTFAFVGCTETEATTNDYEDRIARLEFDLAYQNEIIDSLIQANKANGDLVSYESFLLDNEMADESQNATGNFDDTIAPTYMQNEQGEYISFSELAIMLKAKYFGDNTGSYSQASDIYAMIPYATMVYTFTHDDLTVDEAIARLILLIEELVNYTYYALSSNGINILIIYDDGYEHQIRCQIPKIVIESEIFTVNYDSLIGGEFETFISTNEGFNEYNVKQYYDEYVINGTFDGYVLNYVE